MEVPGRQFPDATSFPYGNTEESKCCFIDETSSLRRPFGRRDGKPIKFKTSNPKVFCRCWQERVPECGMRRRKSFLGDQIGISQMKPLFLPATHLRNATSTGFN